MQLVNNIYQSTSDYIQDIPSNTLTSTAQATLMGFAIGLVFSGDLSKGLSRGAMCGIATMISGLVTPLFNFANGNQPTRAPLQEIAKIVVSTAGAIVALDAYGLVNKEKSFAGLGITALIYLFYLPNQILSNSVTPIIEVPFSFTS